MNIELDTWKDGRLRLSYWDSIGGEDKFFILENGQAKEEIFDDDIITEGPVEEREVNLVEALTELFETMHHITGDPDIAITCQ